MKNDFYSHSALDSLFRDSEILADLQAQSDEIRSSLADSSDLGVASGLPLELGNEELFERAEVLLEGVSPTQREFGEPEAIILSRGRPALLVQDGVWEESKIQTINDRLESASKVLKEAIPKVGRIEILNHPQHGVLGTGWRLDEDYIITNRHVAEFFARRDGDRFLIGHNVEGSRYETEIDFLQEHERPGSFVLPIEEAIYLEERGSHLPDMALLRIKDNGSLPAPIEIEEALPEFRDSVAVIGYPAYDVRNDIFVMRRIFNDIYNVKRLAPGQISGLSEDGLKLMHDCTTLGGNSGSVVLSLESGRAVGLHFSGSFGKNNYAVSCAALRQKLASVLSTSVVVPSLSVEQEEEASPMPFPGDGYQADFLGELHGVSLPSPGLAIADSVAPVKARGDGVLDYLHYSVVMNKDRRLALYTAVNIDGNAMHNVRRRRDKWRLDERIDLSHQVGEELYKNNPLDRGHLVRRLDPAWGDREAAVRAAEETFFFTNCAPQHSALNQRTWLRLEDHILDHSATHDFKVSVFTGPVFRADDRIYRGIGIPEEFWKVVVMVNAFTGKLSATGYLVSQRDHLSDLEFVFGAFRTFQVPIELIEELTHLSFGDLPSFDPIGQTESNPARVLESVNSIIL